MDKLPQPLVTEDPHSSPDNPEVHKAIGDYYDYINWYSYSCEVDTLRGLAQMWVEDPRFAVNYERVRPGGAAFVQEAVDIFCDQHLEHHEE